MKQFNIPTDDDDPDAFQTKYMSDEDRKEIEARQKEEEDKRRAEIEEKHLRDKNSFLAKIAACKTIVDLSTLKKQTPENIRNSPEWHNAATAKYLEITEQSKATV